MQDTEYNNVQWETLQGSTYGQRQDAQEVLTPFLGNPTDDQPTATSTVQQEPSTSTQAGKEGTNNATIKVSVSTPRKEEEGTPHSFISYLVKTERTYGPESKTSSHEVRRRFHDFVWLHEQLLHDFPACVIPPFPGKHIEKYLVGDRFSEEFRSEYENPKGDNTVLDIVGDTLLNSLSRVRSKDEKFIELAENIDRLHSHLTSINKLFSKVTKRQMKIQQAYSDFGNGLASLGDIETGITSPLVSAANALREHGVLLQTLSDRTEDLFLAKVEEYIQYCESYKYTLKVRDQKQAESEDLEEYLKLTNNEHERLSNYKPPQGMSAVTSFIRGKVRDLRGMDRNIDRQKRIHTLEERAKELEEALNISVEESKTCSQQVLDEYEIFSRIKRQDMKDSFSQLATSHIEFYKKVGHISIIHRCNVP
ncbi:intercellular trafficking and secretion [Mycoemilia scoparia]|uniref:Sorting nexin-4 n=1 Tax=Mycoemilia scoparia TaxID=417184 RepID=A0A9W8DQU4_9FUNG|nr:intercellular trafficking and secretion [Mycoemilia scoparia]